MIQIFLLKNYCLFVASGFLFCLGFFLSVRAEMIRQEYQSFKTAFSFQKKEKLKKRLLAFIREHRLMSFLEIEGHCHKLKRQGNVLAMIGGSVFLITLSLKFLY